MARTITEISEEIKHKFVQNERLRQAYDLEDAYANSSMSNLAFFNAHFSTLSLEVIFIYIVAGVIATLENMFDWFREDVSKIVENERYGYAGWYKKMALKFQYGDDINNNYLADSAISDFAESAIYETENADLQVVKYAYAETATSGLGVDIKIATENNDLLAPLSEQQEAAFTAYMNRIKPAGVLLNIVNRHADRLRLELIIYYNSLILNEDGVKISDNTKPVEEAIQSYLNGIEFNGEFVKMKLVDEIQKVDGVEVVELRLAERFYDNDFEEIEVKFTPRSGYMNLDFENDLQINFIAD